jgi:hypothetical protein
VAYLVGMCVVELEHIRIEKHTTRRLEVDLVLLEVRLGLGRIPFEIHDNLLNFSIVVNAWPV